MNWDIDFSTGIVTCNVCKKLMKGHIDEIITKGESGPSMLNKECFKNTSLFVGNYWDRYNKEDGTMNTNFSSYCDEDEGDEE